MPVRATALHRDRSVRRWLIAYTLSLLGDGAYFLALGRAAAQLLGPANIGVVLAVGAAPRAVLMLWGGVLTDRLGPRRVVLISDSTRALLVLAAAAVLTWSAPGWWLLLTVAAAYGVADALFLPAVASLPALLTDRGDLTRLHGLRALAVRLGDTAGPAAAGILLGVAGPAAAFTAIGVLFTVSLVLLLTLRLRPPPHPDSPRGPTAASEGSAREPGTWRSLLEGLRYLRRQRLIATLLASLTLTELGVIPPLNLGVLLLAQRHGWGPSGAGAIVAAFAAGAGAGALLLTLCKPPPHAGAAFISAKTMAVSALAAITLAPTLPAALTLGAITGLGFGYTGALVFALIQTVTAHRYLGRVMSTVYLASVGLTPLSYPAFNALAATVGITTTWSVFAGIAMLGAAVAAGCRALRAIAVIGPSPRADPVQQGGVVQRGDDEVGVELHVRKGRDTDTRHSSSARGPDPGR